MLHPSFIQHQWSLRYMLIHDLKLALKESAFPQRLVPPREFIIDPTLAQIENYRDRVLEISDELERDFPAEYGTRAEPTSTRRIFTMPYPKAILGTDYETKPPFIRCKSFALDTKHAISIPVTDVKGHDYWKDPEEEARVWLAIADINDSAIPKAGQNYLTYDLFYDLYYGLPLRNFWGDTRYMHKAYQPELPTTLEVLASIFTYPVQNYYKEEGKSDYAGFTQELFWQYSCTDSVLMPEIAPKLRDELVEASLWDVYVERYLKKGPHLCDMTLSGVPWDVALQRQLHTFYEWVIAGLNDEVTRIAGHPVNVRSHLQMKKLLYEEQALPKMYKLEKGKRALTCDAKAMFKLRANFPSRGALLSALLATIKARGRQANTIDATYDKRDNHMRGSYPMATETGRLNSTENPFGTGRNMQNFERVNTPDNEPTNMRNLIIATPHPRRRYMLFEADYRQIEVMIVAWLANEPALMHLFKIGADIHTENASRIFKIPTVRISIKQRYLGKVTSHGADYDMGWSVLIETIILQTEGTLRVRASESKALLGQYHFEYPNIKAVFHVWVRDCLDKNMTLHTPFGRRRQFFGHDHDEHTYKEGYAYVPQSIPPDLVNDAIVILRSDGYDIRMQTHDSLAGMIHEGNAVATYEATARAMHQPVNLRSVCPVACDEPLIVPVDYGVGAKLGALKVLKKMSPNEIKDYLTDAIDWRHDSDQTVELTEEEAKGLKHELLMEHHKRAKLEGKMATRIPAKA